MSFKKRALLIGLFLILVFNLILSIWALVVLQGNRQVYNVTQEGISSAHHAYNSMKNHYAFEYGGQYYVFFTWYNATTFWVGYSWSSNFINWTTRLLSYWQHQAGELPDYYWPSMGGPGISYIEGGAFWSVYRSPTTASYGIIYLAGFREDAGVICREGYIDYTLSDGSIEWLPITQGNWVLNSTASDNKARVDMCVNADRRAYVTVSANLPPHGTIHKIFRPNTQALGAGTSWINASITDFGAGGYFDCVEPYYGVDIGAPYGDFVITFSVLAGAGSRNVTASRWSETLSELPLGNITDYEVEVWDDTNSYRFPQMSILSEGAHLAGASNADYNQIHIIYRTEETVNPSIRYLHYNITSGTWSNETTILSDATYYRHMALGVIRPTSMCLDYGETSPWLVAYYANYTSNNVDLSTSELKNGAWSSPRFLSDSGMDGWFGSLYHCELCSMQSISESSYEINEYGEIANYWFTREDIPANSHWIRGTLARTDSVVRAGGAEPLPVGDWFGDYMLLFLGVLGLVLIMYGPYWAVKSARKKNMDNVAYAMVIILLGAGFVIGWLFG